MRKTKKKPTYIGINYSEYGIEVGELKNKESKSFNYMGHKIEVMKLNTRSQEQIMVIIPDLEEAFKLFDIWKTK